MAITGAPRVRPRPTLFGGASIAQQNVISGNQTAGIDESGGSATIEGNVIGASPDQTVPAGNDIGIFLHDGNGGNVVQGNLIGGSSTDGVYVSNEANGIVSGNSIGLAPGGENLRNGGAGVYVEHGDAHGKVSNTVGASGTWPGNTSSTCLYAIGGTNGYTYLSSVEMANPGTLTAAWVTHFVAQWRGGSVHFAWRMPAGAHSGFGVVGFNLSARSCRLNTHLIRVHEPASAAHVYHFVAHHVRHGAYRLAVVLANGSQVVVASG